MAHNAAHNVFIALPYKHNFVIFNFAVNIKFSKKSIVCSLGIHNCLVIYFFINVITKNVFYSMYNVCFC